ncbi:hypothetical protein YDYSG_27480 [Paenibacillus tyrfis]|uniref:tRNA-guanine transglycosylase n=1 Tax=Paenibacillus tyrfis TaxID=1501230 RepID=UPI002493A9A6|nr:tRNA-guanine transglycosylase [Paenibacillus tyrfis]GLI06718.1 hypothetical protein YDYSG_27480 [Paenibacillus tyrfis]
MQNKYTYSIENGKRIGMIQTSRGTIKTPNFFPVTTYGDKYPLDKLVQPYLRRLSDCIMVSYYYAKQMPTRPNIPVFIDSGGFASLFEGSEILQHKGYSTIKTKEGDEITPLDLLEFQEKNADLAATLDFIIPPGLDLVEARKRQKLTIENALYALTRKRSKSLFLYASLQCWDEKSARIAAKEYASSGFDGIAIGGLVPRIRDKDYLYKIIYAVRESAPDLAIHAFGIGNPETVLNLWRLGLDSSDSSSFVRNEVNKENPLPFRLFISKTHSGPMTPITNALSNLWLLTEETRFRYFQNRQEDSSSHITETKSDNLGP